MRADDAGLLHRSLQIVSSQPSTRLRHIGHILKDQDIVRVFGAAKHFAVRDACRSAALLMLVVTFAPRRLVLRICDFVAVAVGKLTNRPNGTLYTGVTSDIGRRAYEHRQGLAAGFTK